jgi:hypothetical protein
VHEVGECGCPLQARNVGCFHVADRIHQRAAAQQQLSRRQHLLRHGTGTDSGAGMLLHQADCQRVQRLHAF